MFQPQGEKDELAEILNREPGWKCQTAVALDEMEVLLKNEGELTHLNEQVGNCYCHTVKHRGKEFFTATGVERMYDIGGKKFILDREHKKYTENNPEALFTFVK